MCGSLGPFQSYGPRRSGGSRPPDALFVANSLMAIGALQALAARGLRAGRDIGMVVVDDAPWTQLVDPPITVVAQPAHARRRVAVV
jgi:LacI family transcriptional regulator